MQADSRSDELSQGTGIDPVRRALSRSPWLPARGTRGGLVAIGAIHGFVAARLKGHLRFLAAARAGGRVHLPLGPVVPSVVATAIGRTGATTLAVPPFSTAARAALRILIAASGMELLIVRAEGELVAALDTG